ncbi:hypothetical protein IFM89_003701 [Coptis chinensis]|uniref:Aldehyde dehydrogenase domain-containing protein n=1 Tax=Coptis chinensis TaxID=261450 RepID=A0A835IUJ7_9MAGN|nr:hypothetical protein IFM89_003701 [Coptis chinensis]
MRVARREEWWWPELELLALVVSGGWWRSAARAAGAGEVYDPATGDVIANLACMGRRETSDAISSASESNKPGAVNVVMGNASEIGDTILESPQVSLELGGNATCIVFDDADLDLAVKISHHGSTGVAIEIADAFVGTLKGELSATAVNAPMVPAEVLSELAPYVVLAKKLGRLAVQLVGGGSGVKTLKVTYASARVPDDLDTRLLRAMITKGLIE